MEKHEVRKGDVVLYRNGDKLYVVKIERIEGENALVSFIAKRGRGRLPKRKEVPLRSLKQMNSVWRAADARRPKRPPSDT